MSKKWFSKLSDQWGTLASELPEAPIIPTLSPSLNWATDTGGFTGGKISILFGPESSGKSLLAMMAIAHIHKNDPEAIALWFDSEFSFNAPLFKKVGGDPKRLRVKKTNRPIEIFDFIANEVAAEIQDGMPLKSIVIDSIKSIRFPVEANKKTTEDQHMGGAGSKYLGGAIKLILPVIAENQIFTFFIQQASSEIDPMKALRNPFVMTEGRALKHAADLLLEITKLDTKAGSLEEGVTIAGGNQQVGHKVRIKVKKNRLGVPARVAQFTWHYDDGVINTEQEIFDLGKSLNLIYHPVNPETGKTNAQMWQFADYSPIRGEANMLEFVRANKNVQDEIIAAANKHKSPKVEVDEYGVVIETEDTVVDLED